MNKIFLIALGLFVFTSVNAQESQYVLNKSQIMAENFSALESQFGAYDTNNIYVNESAASAGVIFMSSKITSTKGYTLILDNHDPANPTVTKLFFTSDINTVTSSDHAASADQNGTAILADLDGKTGIEIKFTNGEKSVIQRSADLGISTNNLNFATYASHFENPSLKTSPLVTCIKAKLQSMSWGEWAIYIATFPESLGAIGVACAIDLYIIH